MARGDLPIPAAGGCTIRLLPLAEPRAVRSDAHRRAARGGQVTLAERWNGTAWAVQRSAGDPAGTQPSFLNAVSCTSARACTAAGGFGGQYPSFSSGTLAERWNGSKWAIQRTPNPYRAAFSELSGVSCTSARACTAVGQYFSGARGGDVPLAERWNGSKWVIQRAPGFGFLNAVSCPSARFCIAVGEDPRGGPPLAELWNGSKWVWARITGGRAEAVLRLAERDPAAAMSAVDAAIDEARERRLPFELGRCLLVLGTRTCRSQPGATNS